METQLYIGGQATAATAGRTFERRNPVSGEVVTRAAAASVADAIAAVEAAATAFRSWSQSGPTARRLVLLKAAELLEAKAGECIGAMAAEVGASQLWAGFNVHAAVGIFREAAALTTQVQGETLPTDRPGALSLTVRQPAGVVLSIVPWNGAVALAARAIAYPLAFGNTVVFRASETSPKSHQLVAEALREAGLPAGVLNFVTNAPDDAAAIIEALIAHPAVRRINFTGSTRVGRLIAEQAGRHLKRCLLELGGKSPLLVLDDADLDEAVKAAVLGCFLYQGQICMTTGRIVVDAKVADRFVEQFAARARELPLGDPAAGGGGCVVGPLISPESVTRLEALLADAVAKGARVVTGGVAQGAFMPATIVDGVAKGMRLYDEEAFGPVIAIVRARDAEDALAIANDTEYGLAGAVFGRDVQRALEIALRLEAGHCHVNGSTIQGEPQAPYGGMKASGYGRFDGGRAVIDEFTELRWITVGPRQQQYPF